MTCQVKRCGFEGVLALVYCGVGVSVGVGGGGGHAGPGGGEEGRHCGQRVTPVLIVIPAIMEGGHPPTASRSDPECRSGGHDPWLGSPLYAHGESSAGDLI